MATYSPNIYSSTSGQVNYAFTFASMEESDIKVSVGGTLTIDFTITGYTTTGGGTVVLTAAPPTVGTEVIVYRDTDITGMEATFISGSAITAANLNSDFYSVQGMPSKKIHLVSIQMILIYFIRNRVSQNETDIAQNTSDIADNTADIATNTSNIAANAANISTNTSNIATNTSDIADNTQLLRNVGIKLMKLLIRLKHGYLMILQLLPLVPLISVSCLF